MRLNKIFDSQETASIKEARKLLVEKAGMTDEQADKWVRGDLRAAFPILRDKKAAKFILGTTRLFVEQQLNNADAQNKMSRILKEINEAHYDEFDRNLNGKSLQDLYSPFEQTFKEADKATRESSSSKQFGKSDYTIYGPYDSFEDAEEAWGNNSQTWCVFHDEDAYGNYTSAGQRFYVAAQDGWKSIPKEVGDYAPKDAYGNSLIAISVDLEGNLATSTPRWNHANGGGDHTYTVDELEGILQMSFYDTFKPYSDEERRARGIMSFEEAAERLASGEDPHCIFNNISPFREGFACVQLNGKWNFIDINNNLLSDQWFDEAASFCEGFAWVWLNGKCNYIDTNNNLLSDQWFDDAYSFSSGFAHVELNDKSNFIDTKGNLLSDQWFDDAYNFNEGFARVELNDKYNFIDTKGNLLSDQWFDDAYNFSDGFADVFLNGRWYRIDKSGKIVDSRVSNLNLKRLSKLMDATKRQREMIRSWAEKANKNGDEIISWAESNFKNDNEQLAAAKWWIDGYPTNTFKQALYICGQKKMDPLKQDPEKLVKENPDVKPKEKPINPDDVLTDKQDEGDGITTYAARDEDRQVIREILNTHFGKDASPWCLLQGDGNGRLTSSSADYWEHYNAYPKRIAFMKGRLLAFSAGSNPKVREWWDRSDRSFPFIPYNGKVWVGKSGDTFEIKKGEVFKTSADNSYRARLSNCYSENIEESFDDASYYSDYNTIYLDDTRYPVASQDDKYYYIDCPKLKGKVDKETLTPEGDFTYFFHDGEEGLKEVSRQCTYKNGVLNGIDKSFYFGGGIRSECTYVNDRPEGESVSYFENGQLYTKCTYKNGERQGLYERYSSNGNIRERCNYVDDERDGLFQAFRSDGTLEREGEYKGGQKDGKHVEYFDNGKPDFKCTYTGDQKNGLATWYFEEGGIHKQFTYKNGSREGQFTIYYLGGQLKTEGTYSNDDLNGHIVEYYENGNIRKDCNYQDGWPVGTVTEYYENEQIREQYTKDGHGNRVGEYVSYYFNGQLNEKCTYSHDNHKSGPYESYYENGNPKKKCNYDENGNLDGDLVSFYESGNKQASAHFTDDLLNGEYITYREDGSVISRRFFKNGDEVKS